MLAVFTGFGQRRTLLKPLIKKRQPKITRKNASARPTRVECSNLSSMQMMKFVALYAAVMQWSIVRLVFEWFN
jgi:hypothetical protein